MQNNDEMNTVGGSMGVSIGNTTRLSNIGINTENRDKQGITRNTVIGDIEIGQASGDPINRDRAKANEITKDSYFKTNINVESQTIDYLVDPEKLKRDMISIVNLIDNFNISSNKAKAINFRDEKGMVIDDTIKSYEGTEDKVLYAVRKNGEKVFARDISKGINKVENIGKTINGKLITENDIFVTINGLKYFKNVNDAQYDILTNLNILSSSPEIAVEYAGLVFEAKGKNGEIGYGYTPAYTTGEVTLSSPDNVIKYVPPSAKIVQGYHTHGRANNHIYNPKNGEVNNILVNFFSFPDGSMGGPSDVSYSKIKKFPLSLGTPGELNPNNLKTYSIDPEGWIYYGNSEQIDYLGKISDYKSQIDNSRLAKTGETIRQTFNFLPSGVRVPKFLYPKEWYNEKDGELIAK